MINSSVKGKSFILVIPNDFGIYEIFNFNIEKLGFKLTYIIPEDFKYKNKKARVINFLNKTFLKDRRYKKELIKQFHSNCVEEKIAHLPEKSIDYILIIRADILELDTLQKLMKIGKKVVSYQWDGLERFPKIFEYIDYFETFLVFDQYDYDTYKKDYPNLEKCENFYFDFDENDPNIKDSNIIYYVGSYIKERTNDLVAIVQELEKHEVQFDINLRYHPKTKPINEKNIKFFRENLDFKANIRRLKKAKVLLDFKVNEHNGLSLRFFEALKYKKKIITNNKTVMDYDFYNPQNIFIMHHDNYNTLSDFINSDYQSISDEIVDQYSFSTWLSKYVV